jgi:hypothetical protein
LLTVLLQTYKVDDTTYQTAQALPNVSWSAINGEKIELNQFYCRTSVKMHGGAFQNAIEINEFISKPTMLPY